MKLTADYHTHTIYSHGKGRVLDNAMIAKEKGLIELGISDHGFYHGAFGLSKKKIPSLIEDCLNASKQTGVKVLVGVESNVIGADGSVDLSEKYYDYFDLFLAGLHKFVFYKPNGLFNVAIPNLFYSTFKAKNVPKSLIKSNTKTLINVIKKNPIDVITHPNFCSYIDVEEVAKVASDYGTYLELNAKKEHLSDEQIERVLKTDVRFIIDSDAHTPDRVGEISLVEKLIERNNFPIDRIDNVDGRIPNFRFKKFKSEAGR